MSRTYRNWSPEQVWLFPPSPQDGLPEGHLVYFLMDVDREITKLYIPIADENSQQAMSELFHPTKKADSAQESA